MHHVATEAMEISTRQGKQICPICKSNNSNLKRHIQSVHEGIKPPHTDGYCGHKSHDNIKKADKTNCPICPICEKYFSYKSSLKNHIQGRYEGIRHPCLECSYTSADKSTLSRHMKTHTKYKHLVFPFATGLPV